MKTQQKLRYRRIVFFLVFTAIAFCMALSGCRSTKKTGEAAQKAVLQEIRDRGVLKVGTTGDYQPMSYLDPETGEYVGFDTELTEDLADSLDVSIEYVETSWPTLMDDVLAGKFDLAICGITVNDARKEQALMSDGYLVNGKTILCRAEDAGKYTSLEAINRPEVRVMVNPGGLNEQFARENLPDAALTIHDVNQEIPALIASGEADIMITEIVEAGYYIGQDSRLAAPMIKEPFTRGEIGILMPKGSEDLLDYVNEFLQKEKKSGRIDELSDEYFSGSSVSDPKTAEKIVEEIAVDYGTYGAEAEDRIGILLKDLADVDKSAGTRWKMITDLWMSPGLGQPLHYDNLPDGLPGTDELCIVVLGFQLNPDGTMKEELTERLGVALASAEKYPNAYIVCTGGGTAAGNPDATEAGEMAGWLLEHGIKKGRVIVEDNSLTTAQNAIFTYDILTSRYPSVKKLAIISSDYHIATGELLFTAETILRANAPGNEKLEVISNAAWKAPSGSLSAMFQAGALIELFGDVETAFEIYYDNYDIHSLPPLH